jgi:hypothetical protein
VTQSGAVSASGGVDEEAVRDILQQIHTVGGPQKSAAPVVVVVFLAPNLMTSSNEAKRFARDVLSYSSPLVYAISTRAPLTSKGAKAPETNLIDSLAKETGGQRFSLASNQGRGALEEIVDGLHACYKVAWIPPPPYEGWHDLRVELTPGAIHRYGKIRMAYRSGYMSKFPGEPHKVSSNPVERITVEN